MVKINKTVTETQRKQTGNVYVTYVETYATKKHCMNKHWFAWELSYLQDILECIILATSTVDVNHFIKY